MPDYTTESDNLAHITEVILHLFNYMEENPVSYPHAMRVYTTLQFGLIPVFHIDCPLDHDCEIKGPGPCGGLADVLETIDTAYECLDLEMDYEVPAFVCPADFSI
jgi:hypothetical protein